MQNYFTAFSAAGYGSVHSLVGLTDNHLTVIGRGSPGGLPDEHRRIILAASQQLGTSQSLQSAATATAAGKVPNPTTASLQPSLQPGPLISRQQVDQQAAPGQPPHRTGTARLVASHGLDSSMSSFTDFSSSGSETGSYASTVQSSIAAPTRRAAPQEPSRLAPAVDKPAPSQCQLQELYSHLQADFQKLQPRPVHLRASNHPTLPAVPVTANSFSPVLPLPQASATSAAAGREVSNEVAIAASQPAAASRLSGNGRHGPKINMQAAAGIPATAAALPQARSAPPKQPSRSQQQSHPAAAVVAKVNGTSSSSSRAKQSLIEAAHGSDRITLEQADPAKGTASQVERVSAAAAVKQMRKENKAQSEEPFVQVFTNFHTLSKVHTPWTDRCDPVVSYRFKSSSVLSNSVHRQATFSLCKIHTKMLCSWLRLLLCRNQTCLKVSSGISCLLVFKPKCQCSRSASRLSPSSLQLSTYLMQPSSQSSSLPWAPCLQWHLRLPYCSFS